MDGGNFDEDAEINAVLSRYTDRDDAIESESLRSDEEATEVAGSFPSAPLGSGVRQSSSRAGSNLRAPNRTQPADDQIRPVGANPMSLGQNSGGVPQSASAARMQEHLRLLEDQLAAGRQAIALEQQWTQEIRNHHRAIARLEQSQRDLAEQYGDSIVARRGQAASSSSASASSGPAGPSLRAGATAKDSEGSASALNSASNESSLGGTGRAAKRRRVEPPRRGRSQMASHSTARPGQPEAGLPRPPPSYSVSSSSRSSAPMQGAEDAATTRNQLQPQGSDSPGAVRGVYEIGGAGETGGSTTSSSATSTGGGSSSTSAAHDKSAPLHSRLHVSQSMLEEIAAALDSMPRVVKQSDTRELVDSMVSGIRTYWRDPTDPDGQVAPVFRINLPRDNHRAIAGPSLDQKRILVSTPNKMLKLSLPTEDARATMKRFRQTCIYRPGAASGSHIVSKNRQEAGTSPRVGPDPSVDGGTRGSTRDSEASQGASDELPHFSLLIKAPKVVASEVQKQFLSLSVAGSPVYILSDDKRSVVKLALGGMRSVHASRDVALCCWSPSKKTWIVTTFGKVYSKFMRATASEQERESLARLVQMYTTSSRHGKYVSGPKQPPSSRADIAKRGKSSSASRKQREPTRQSKRASSAKVGSFEELDSDIDPVGGSGSEEDGEYIARSPALGTKRSRDSSIGSKPSAASKSSAPSAGEKSAQRTSATLGPATSGQSRMSFEPPNPESQDMPPAGIIRSMPNSMAIDDTVKFAQQVAAGVPVYFYEETSDSVERLGPNGLVSRLRRKPMACRSATGSAWLVSAFTRIPAALQAGKLAQKHFNAIYERYGPSRQANGSSGAAASTGEEQSNPTDVPPASLLAVNRVPVSESDTDEVASQLAAGAACFRSSRSGDSVSPVPCEFVPDSAQGDPIACRSADGSKWVRTTFHRVFNRLASGKLPDHVVQTVRSTFMTRPSWKDSAADGSSGGDTTNGGNSSGAEKREMTKGDAGAVSLHVSVAAKSSSSTGSSKASKEASGTVAAGSLADSSEKGPGFAARDESASPAAPPGGEPNSPLKRSLSKSGSRGSARGGSPANSSLGHAAPTGDG